MSIVSRERVPMKPGMERNGMEPIGARADFKTAWFPSLYQFHVTFHSIPLKQIALQYTITLPFDIYYTFFI